MEFWGVEVKPGVPHKVTFTENRLIHISQAALGETKKGNENVVLFVNFNGKKLVVGTLSMDKCPQIQCDLVFEKEFELCHNSKNGSVYFSGYKGFLGPESPSDDSDDSDSDDEIPLVANGKPEPLEGSKVGSSEAKPKVKIVEPKKGDESEDDDSEDSSDEEESDEEAKKRNKRSAETSASKTPADKKAKLMSTPQKSGADGKKGSGVHIATPHPAKKAGKGDKSKQETPKSAATPVSCNTCSKTFNSEKGLESHTKAKH
ncbi:hypothetical protein C5167_033892 [Papaver somniferum]|uniref:C2H2-type domain-containing protein n=1 Tax=Papaver somniferum TaxID=3469 RepID=A0A4Y7KCT6_PAPSO|nr:hypothetical protein C5167_033892 [Papaver somniferum]